MCLITSDCVDAPRLKTVSQIMVDKIVSVPRSAVRAEVGQCDADEIEAVDVALRRWLGMA